MPCTSSSDSEITRTAAASHRTGVVGGPSAALSHRLTFSIAGTKVPGFCLPVSVYRVGPYAVAQLTRKPRVIKSAPDSARKANICW